MRQEDGEVSLCLSRGLDGWRNAPNIVTLFFQDQENNRAERREREISEAGLVVKAQSKGGVEFGDHSLTGTE